MYHIYAHLFGWVPSTMKFSVSKKNGNFWETWAPQAIFAILKKSSLELMPTACGARVSPRLGPFILPSTKKLLPNASCAKVITWKMRGKCLEVMSNSRFDDVLFQQWNVKFCFFSFVIYGKCLNTSSFDSSVTWILFALILRTHNKKHEDFYCSYCWWRRSCTSW